MITTYLLDNREFSLDKNNNRILRVVFSLGTLNTWKIGKDLIERFLLQKRSSQLQISFRFESSIIWKLI